MKEEEVDLKALAKKIAEKHEKYLKEYAKEKKELSRIIILEEKIDQIDHWIQENEGKEAEKYLNKIDETERELREAKKKYPEQYPTKKIKELEKKIQEHEEALKYWRKR